MPPSKREQALLLALRTFAPGIPRFECQEVIAHALASPGLRKGSAEAAAWLSLLAVIRHIHTDYDLLLSQGYDHDAARFYVREQINDQIRQWGGHRQVSGH